MIVACASTARGGAGREPPNARATLELVIPNQVSGSVRNGGFDVILRNTSADALWVNARLVARNTGHPETVLGFVELVLEIAGPSGTATYNCHERVGFATVADYVVLTPGEKRETKLGFSCFEPIETVGHYTVRARYQDRTPHPPPAPPATQHLAEEVVSEPVQFDVVTR